MVLPRQQLSDDSEMIKFLTVYVGKFDMYVEDDYAAFVRYCFEDPLDAGNFPLALGANGRALQAGGLRSQRFIATVSPS
jgi:hypothetical protein